MTNDPVRESLGLDQSGMKQNFEDSQPNHRSIRINRTVSTECAPIRS